MTTKKLPVIRLQDPRAIAYIEEQQALGREMRRTVELALVAAYEASRTSEEGQVTTPVPTPKPPPKVQISKPQAPPAHSWNDDNDGFELPPLIGDFNL